FDTDLYEEAEKQFLDLETTYRSAYGGDALGLADITYHLSRSISRGMEKSGSRTSDPQRYREQAARALHYGRAAYVHAKKYSGDPDQISTLGTYLCSLLINHEPEPDLAEIEAIAREARDIRERLFEVGSIEHTHPLNMLLIALAAQDKVEE